MITLVCVFFLICGLFGLKIGFDIKYERDLEKVYELRDKSLDSYKQNESLAKSYLYVYDIVDEDSYQRVKNEIYYSFSNEMQNLIFPTVNYSGVDLHSMSTQLIKVMGTNNGPNEKNTFLIEYVYTTPMRSQNITDLIEIEDGVICNVVRIK